MNQGPRNDTKPTNFDPARIDWDKCDGLVPAIVQDATSRHVLMLGYMNADAIRETRRQHRVTFFSRTRNRLWTKGETSGNWLEPVSIALDCDADCLLIQARPTGPVCHEGSDTCFGDRETSGSDFLMALQSLIESRRTADPETSYTARLLGDEVDRIAQKVGEESVETVLAATGRDRDGLVDEAADLVYHLLVLLTKRDCSIEMVIDRLRERHREN